MHALLPSIQALAGEWPVVVPDTGTLRLSLPEGLYYDSTPAGLLHALDNGLINLVLDAAQVLRQAGWRFAGGPWAGPLFSYPVVSLENDTKRCVKRVPWSPKTRNRLLQLDTEWRLRAPRSTANPPHFSLQAAKATGIPLRPPPTSSSGDKARSKRKTVTEQPATPVGAHAQLRNFAALGANIEPGYELLDTVWRGVGASYRWRTTDGAVIHAAIATLKKKSLRIGFAAKAVPGFDLLETESPIFTWTLPDSSTVDATLQIFEAALSQVLEATSNKSRPFVPKGFSAKVREAVAFLAES